MTEQPQTSSQVKWSEKLELLVPLENQEKGGVL